MKQNKKHKQTLESAHYGLEIIFKPLNFETVKQHFSVYISSTETLKYNDILKAKILSIVFCLEHPKCDQNL